MFKRTMMLFLVIAASLAPAFAQEKKAPEPLKLKAGDVAPDFTLLAYDGTGVKPVSLHDFKGKKNVVVAFYVFAFTGG
jgi:cytochrome oxidase Cu insertion factor (SCO1/SenC/PrrC family)